MRYTINQIREGEDELILNYRQLNPEVEKVIAFMDQNQKKMIGRVDGETILFSPEEILYIEKVDGRDPAHGRDDLPYLYRRLYSGLFVVEL